MAFGLKNRVSIAPSGLFRGIATAALATGILLFDVLATAEIAAAVLYVVVVLMAARFLPPRGVVFTAAGCVGLTILGYLLTPAVAPAYRGLSNTSLSIFAIVLITFLVLRSESTAAALRISEQHWRDVFENNPTMYFMVDATGIVLAVNPFGAEQLGYTVNELVGQPVTGVFIESDRDAAQEKIAACLGQLGRSFIWELRKSHKDGSVMWVRETAKGVVRVNDRVVLIACEDITEQKRAEEKLRQAQANLERVNRVMLVGEMTASIAHEVNQPLTGVRAHAGSALRWLAAQPPNLEEARAALDLVVRDGKRAGEVIGRIRALVDKVPPRRDPLCVQDAIREVIALIQDELQKNSIDLQTEWTSDLPLIIADRVQFQQVMLNLIANAIEAMSGVEDRPRSLKVCGRRELASGVVIEVRDSGVGLHPDDLPRVFESFYTTKRGGVGMGLAISRSIVEAHGGRLDGLPNSPVGAVFRITLPIDAGP